MPPAPIWFPPFASPRHRDNPINFVCKVEKSARASQLPQLQKRMSAILSEQRQRKTSRLAPRNCCHSEGASGESPLPFAVSNKVARGICFFLAFPLAHTCLTRAYSRVKRVTCECVFVAQGARCSWRGPGDFSCAGFLGVGRGAISIPVCAELVALISFSSQQ